jgi:hypothetical protein
VLSTDVIKTRPALEGKEHMALAESIMIENQQEALMTRWQQRAHNESGVGVNVIGGAVVYSAVSKNVSGS